jgi:uncharacterized protein
VRTAFFGPAAEPLLGVFHPAEGQPSRDVVAVLCQPGGHEYVRAHRAIRTLATQFARQGIAAFRFDYFGCGDSAGEAEEATLARWVADTRLAIEEAKRISGAAAVALVGIRLGGAIALAAAMGRSDVRRILLWDPIVKGDLYRSSLESLHTAWLRTGGRQEAPAPGAPLVLGFPLTEMLRRELDALDVMSLVETDSRTTCYLSADRTADATWRGRVTAARGPNACRLVAVPLGWDVPELIHTALAAPQMLQAVTRDLAGVTA